MVDLASEHRVATSAMLIRSNGCSAMSSRMTRCTLRADSIALALPVGAASKTRGLAYMFVSPFNQIRQG
jgi:hypothetical protein